MNKKWPYAAVLVFSFSPAFAFQFSPSFAQEASRIFDGSQQSDSRGLIHLNTLRQTERVEPYFDNRSVRIVTEIKRYRIADREKYADYLAGERGCVGSGWGVLGGVVAGVLASLLASSIWPLLPFMIAGAIVGCLLGRKSGAGQARAQPEEFETKETKIFEVQ